MIMQIKKGLALVELLVALAISAVLILMVGVISQVAFSSHNQLRKEGDVYSDIFYGLSQISFSVRKASTVKIENDTYGCTGQVLVADKSAFCLYNGPDCLACKATENIEGPGIDFVYIEDTDNPNNKAAIVCNAKTMNLTFTPINPSFKSVLIEIEGTNGKESFALTEDNKQAIVITRRN